MHACIHAVVRVVGGGVGDGSHHCCHCCACVCALWWEVVGGGGGGGGDGGHRRRLPLSLSLSVPVACCLESQHVRQARDQDAGAHLCDLDHPHILQGIPMQCRHLVLNVSQIAWMRGESAHASTRDQDVGTHLCGLDHPHILQSIPTKSLAMQTAINPQITCCVSLLYVVVYVRHYTCKSLTKQHCTAGTGVLAGSWRVHGFQDCNPHPHPRTPLPVTLQGSPNPCPTL